MQHNTFPISSERPNQPIKILVVDTLYSTHESIRDYFSFNPYYVIRSAYCLQQALQILIEEKDIKVCLCDIASSHRDASQFYLLKRFGQRIGFVMLYNQENTQAGFEAYKNSAWAVYRKNVFLESKSLVDMVNTIYLFKNLNATFSPLDRSLINICIEQLVYYSPKNINDWASQVGISVVYLRKIWKQCFNTSPSNHLQMVENFRAQFAVNKVEETCIAC